MLEAKPAGYALTNVELQVDKYATGLPSGLNPPVTPLPFLYLGTGVETRFINGLDPDPKTRAVSANLPHTHRPETLAEWIDAEPVDTWVERLHPGGAEFYTATGDARPSSLRARLPSLPPLEQDFLYPNQVEAVRNLGTLLPAQPPASGSGMRASRTLPASLSRTCWLRRSRTTCGRLWPRSRTSSATWSRGSHSRGLPDDR